MKHLTCSNSDKVSIVDEADFATLSSRNWHLNNNGYFYTHQTLLHQMIMGKKKGYIIDHINRDRLDNRRSNLRWVTPSQSLFNTSKRKNGTSQYKGVFVVKPGTGRLKSTRWSCQINFNKKRVHIGHFDTEHQAALAYDLWAKDIAGEHAKLNFNV